MTLKAFIPLSFLVFGLQVAEAKDVVVEQSGYQSGADPEYVSDEFKFSHPKDWVVEEFGVDWGGALINFPNNKRSGMAIDVAWKAGIGSLQDWSKDLKRRFSKNIFLEKVIKLDGRDAYLSHIIMNSGKLTQAQKDSWTVVVVCNDWGIGLSYSMELALPADDKIKNAQEPPKEFQELLNRFKCIKLKKK